MSTTETDSPVLEAIARGDDTEAGDAAGLASTMSRLSIRRRWGGGSSTVKTDDIDSRKQEFRKVLSHWNENPANFHQAACVFLLGGIRL